MEKEGKKEGKKEVKEGEKDKREEEEERHALKVAAWVTVASHRMANHPDYHIYNFNTSQIMQITRESRMRRCLFWSRPSP